MAKPNCIELPDCEPFPILYEDRSVIAIDKPRGWMLLPVSWQNTGHNLQAAINSSIEARDFWARSRGLKFLRYVHRLDADTSGVLLLLQKSRGVGVVRRNVRRAPDGEKLSGGHRDRTARNGMDLLSWRWRPTHAGPGG